MHAKKCEAGLCYSFPLYGERLSYLWVLGGKSFLDMGLLDGGLLFRSQLPDVKGLCYSSALNSEGLLDIAPLDRGFLSHSLPFDGGG